MALTKHKGKPKTPGSGRKKGTPNRKTGDVKKQLEALNVDPLIIAANIMTGAEKGNPHPWLKTFELWIKTYKGVLSRCYDRAAAFVDTEDRQATLLLEDLHHAMTKIDEFHERSKKELAEGHIPIEIRARVAVQLLDFIYPKRKAIEVTDNRDSEAAEDLTDEELAMIILDDIEHEKAKRTKH